MSHQHRRAVLLPVVLAAVTVVVIACGSTTTAAPTPAGGGVQDTSGPDTSTNPGSCHYRGALPDPACTPGAFDPKITQDTIRTTSVHRGGASKRDRPSP